MTEKVKGLVFEIECPYFCCFRHPTTTSVILTYPIPPFTTIRGFIANALGMMRFPDSDEQLSLQNRLKIGITILKVGNKSIENAMILKLKDTDKEFVRKGKFPSSPMFREFLFNPIYRIYIIDTDCSANDDLVEKIYKNLLDPKRPLYIGQSDDMVDIQKIMTTEVKKTKSNKIFSIVEGVHEKCKIITKLPYKFSSDGKFLYEKTFSIPISPDNLPLVLQNEIDAYLFFDQAIALY